MSNSLKFARRLAEFESHLEWASGTDGRDVLAPIAQSYLHLLRELDDLDEYVGILEQLADNQGVTGRVLDIISDAIDVFDQTQNRVDELEQARRRRAEAEYQETLRRHELAVTVVCPYCGAKPGETCRTAGPNGLGQSKGAGDHKSRYRLATTGAV